MGLPNVAFTWRSVKILRVIVSTMGVIGLIVVFGAIVWAIRLRRDIGDYLNLAVPGDGHLWPTVIIVAAVPCAPVYLLGLKAYLCLRLSTPTKFNESDKNASGNEQNFEHSPRASDDDDDDEDDDDDDNDNGGDDDDDDDADDNDEKHNGHETNRILFFHAILCLLSGCFVAAINVACFFKSSTFQEKIRDDNLLEAMENYGSDDSARSRVDAVQLEFQCCGSENYRDWFRVSWSKQSTEYFDYADDENQREAENNEDQGTPVEDVPFSCCTNKIVEPCGRREVLRASSVCNFDPSNEGTVWNVGCRPIIVAHARVLGLLLIFFLLFLTVYQFVLCVLSRLLQTAHSNEFYIGPEMEHYRAWIFSSISTPCAKYHGSPSRESDEETLDIRSSIKETSDSPIVYFKNKDDDPVEWKHREEHEFMLTPRGSAELVQVDRLRKAQSNPIFFKNGTTSERHRKSRIKLNYYQPLSTKEPDQERARNDKKALIVRSDKSIKASSRSREKLSSKKSNVPLAPVPPPFPPDRVTEHEEKTNLLNKDVKIGESSKLAYELVRFPSKEERPEERAASKPSKQDRRKLMEKFENILKVDETSRRVSGGADVPRPWEQLVQRSIDSSEKNSRPIDEDRTSPSLKIHENSHVLSRFRSADAYDRFRGTLQDTLSRRENIRESSNPIGRAFKSRTCTCCTKQGRNLGRSSRCKVQRTLHDHSVDSEDPAIVYRRSLLPDIPCPPPPPPPLPPPPPPFRTNPCTSLCYPRPTLIKQQQREQRKQRQWNFRYFNNDQPPPWTLPASFARSPTLNANPDDNRRTCACCHPRTHCTANERYFSTFKQDDSCRNYHHLMDRLRD